MSRSAVSPDVARGPLIPFLYFIVPLVTAITPRFSPFLLLLLAFVVIVAGLRRGLPLRALIKPNAAMVALLAVALYAALSARVARCLGACARFTARAPVRIVFFRAHRSDFPFPSMTPRKLA